MAVRDSLAIKALAELGHARPRELTCVSLLLLGASCVPLRAAEAPSSRDDVAAAVTAIALPPQLEPMILRDIAPNEAFAINAAMPVVDMPNPSAPSIAFRGETGLDRLRSLQCLAEAIFYEARSESEEGQRAVAQVVLNRVRHPAYPGSVCGVVYQGPMRAGGGCQFTFTCDGSLGHAARGPDWLRARRIAAEALDGAVYAPVGLATHYHTHQVAPAWAPRLLKAAVIGNHNFYRMPGAWGGPGAFAQAYRGREPSPLTVMANRLPINLGKPRAVTGAAVPLDLGTFTSSLPAGPTQVSVAPPPVAADRLPQSRVRPEFENSGRLLSDLR